LLPAALPTGMSVLAAEGKYADSNYNLKICTYDILCSNKIWHKQLTDNDILCSNQIWCKQLTDNDILCSKKIWHNEPTNNDIVFKIKFGANSRLILKSMN
jgi:hypothetical protein